ncbi:hypothetical protein [Hominifimenecus sp. rT4P-3]|uniref:hypothetical protein n=1 Tax=Hominifimenecus sp. rT4P-3 TaxID=3242979 RepID=UPI003DA5F3C1
MSGTKGNNFNGKFGYQPNIEQRGYQPQKSVNGENGSKKSNLLQPPNKGSNVRPAENEK